MPELFVYYRVPLDRIATTREEVRLAQHRLVQAHPGLQARLLRRPEASEAGQTWMETYAMASQGTDNGGDNSADSAWIDAVHQAGLALAASCDGPRHTEVFVPCA